MLWIILQRKRYFLKLAQGNYMKVSANIIHARVPLTRTYYYDTGLHNVRRATKISDWLTKALSGAKTWGCGVFSTENFQAGPNKEVLKAVCSPFYRYVYHTGLLVLLWRLYHWAEVTVLLSRRSGISNQSPQLVRSANTVSDGPAKAANRHLY